MFDKFREKTDKALLVRFIISSLTLGISFIGFLLLLFFYILMFVAGHGGEIEWILPVTIVSFCVFFISTFYFAVVDKIRKERVKEIKPK